MGGRGKTRYESRHKAKEMNNMGHKQQNQSAGTGMQSLSNLQDGNGAAEFPAGDDQAARMAFQIAKQKSKQDSIAFLRSYLTRRPRSPLSQKALANLLTESGRLGEALGILANLTRDFPTDAGMWNSLGCGLSMAGDMGSAELALKKAVELEPARTTFLCNLAEVLAARGEFIEAEKALLSALDHSSGGEAEKVAMMLDSCRKGQAEKC